MAFWTKIPKVSSMYKRVNLSLLFFQFNCLFSQFSISLFPINSLSFLSCLIVTEDELAKQFENFDYSFEKYMYVIPKNDVLHSNLEFKWTILGSKGAN